MFKNKKWLIVISLLLVGSMMLAACQPAPAADEPVDEEPADEPVEDEPAEEPADEPVEDEPADEPVEDEDMEDEDMEDETEDEDMEDMEDMDSLASCSVDLTGETINYYAQAGLTGPLSTILGTAFVNALNDGISEINEAGGICGAELELDLVDTQYDPEQEVAIYQTRRELEPPPYAILTYGSGATVALSEFVDEDMIVNFASGLNAEATYLPAPGYTVANFPIYPDQFAGFVQFVSENWDDIKPEGAGDDIVVGVIGWEGPFGAGATTPEALAYADSLGVTVLPLETFAISAEADVVAPLQSLALQGANVVYIQSLGFGTAQVIGTLRGIEMWDTVVVGTVNWGMNQDVLNVLGESAVAANGMYGMMSNLYWNDTDSTGVQQALAAFEAGGYPPEDMGVSYLTSYAGVYGMAETIKKTVETYGLEGLTGENYLATMVEMGGITCNLDVYCTDVSGDNRSPRQSQIRQVQVQADGSIQFVVVQDYFDLPDMRPSAE